MGIRTTSPFVGSAQFTDVSGNTHMGIRTRFLFRELSGNRTVRSRTGDTLKTIAQAYLLGLDNAPTTSAADYFWVIGDFQPDYAPYWEDLTIPIPEGTPVIIPSEQVVLETILPRLLKLTSDLEDDGF